MSFAEVSKSPKEMSNKAADIFFTSVPFKYNREYTERQGRNEFQLENIRQHKLEQPQIR